MSAEQPLHRVRPLLRSLNCDGAFGWVLLGACAGVLLLAAAGDAPRVLLRYDRDALVAGELWRLVTGHFVHLNLGHAALNALGLALMWALFARDYTVRQWLLVLVVSAAAIDVGLWFRDPEVAWYVGGSGVLHGVMAAGTLAHVRRGELDGWILAAFIIGKLVYEQWAGTSPFESPAMPVIVNAHLYGAIGGLLVASTLRPAAQPV